MGLYPDELDEFLRMKNDIDVIQAIDYNALAERINNLQETIGVGINGNLPSLNARFSANFSGEGGLKFFEAGEVTSSFNSPTGIRITLTLNRFASTPNIKANNNDSGNNLQLAQLFYTGEETSGGFTLYGRRYDGAQPNQQSNTVAWIAYLPVSPTPVFQSLTSAGNTTIDDDHTGTFDMDVTF